MKGRNCAAYFPTYWFVGFPISTGAILETILVSMETIPDKKTWEVVSLRKTYAAILSRANSMKWHSDAYLQLVPHLHTSVLHVTRAL